MEIDGFLYELKKFMRKSECNMSKNTARVKRRLCMSWWIGGRLCEKMGNLPEIPHFFHQKSKHRAVAFSTTVQLSTLKWL